MRGHGREGALLTSVLTLHGPGAVLREDGFGAPLWLASSLQAGTAFLASNSPSLQAAAKSSAALEDRRATPVNALCLDAHTHGWPPTP